MKITSKLALKVINVLDNDKVKETIQAFSDNFETLEANTFDSISDISLLTVGQVYPKREIMYNSHPAIDGHVGWVNIREGKFAPKWVFNKEYDLGDMVVSPTDNGRAYQCITNGRSAPLSPSFPASDGVTFNDLFSATLWQPSKLYEVNDIVTATSGDKTYYYKCITAGLSEDIEPSWTNIHGLTVIDKSVTWIMLKTVQWQEVGASCNFRPFGKIE